MANDVKMLKFKDVTARVRAFQEKVAAEAEKSAADSTTKQVPEKDPNCVGDKAIPVDPEASKKKQNMPKDNTNTAGTQDNNIEHRDTHPAETGKNKETYSDGDKKDESVSSPTDPLSKIAHRASSIVQRLQQQGVVSTPAAQESGKQAGHSPTNTDVARGIEPDPEFLFKLACTIIETEGGIEAVEPVLRKAAGVEATQEIIAKATEAYSGFVQDGYEQMELEKQAAVMEQEIRYQQAYAAAVLDDMTKNASENEKREIVRIARVHAEALSTVEDPYIKCAYEQGAGDAAAMDDSMAQGGQGEIPGGEQGPASIEEIVQMLQQMVQSGEIDEETAMAVAQQLMGDAQGGGQGGEGGPEGGGGGGEGGPPMPPEAEGPEGGSPPEGAEPPEEKEAAVAIKTASALIKELVIRK